MKEQSKAAKRRYYDGAFHSRYFVGRGIDVGGRPDPLAQYVGVFPLLSEVRTWDVEDGDANLLKDVDDDSFDFLHASHCLEHMKDVDLALRNWIRVVKPDGYLVITVPDEDLYERGSWPSRTNPDHKWTFTVHKRKSWSPKSVNLTSLIERFSDEAELERLQLHRDFFRPDDPSDQTLTPVAECAIEIILRKRPRRAGGAPGEAAVEPGPASIKAMLATAGAHVAAGRLDEAELSYQAALAMDPGELAALVGLGQLCQRREQSAKALEWFDQALDVDPNHVIAIAGRGDALRGLGKLEEAAVAHRKAAELRPAAAGIWVSLAFDLYKLDRFDEAIELCKKVLDRKPNEPNALLHIGLCLIRMGRVGESIEWYRKSIAAAPEASGAHLNLGIALLTAGELELGWGEYQWRLKDERAIKVGGLKRIPIPEWDGSALAGKTIVLRREQGMGDVLQFVRYAPMVAARGGRVVLDVHPTLQRLIAANGRLGEVLTPRNASVQTHFYKHFLSLPYLFGTSLSTIPAEVPYLKAPASVAPPNSVTSARGFKVGLVWAGAPRHQNDKTRSLSLPRLGPFLETQSCSFFSLQVGPRAAEIREQKLEGRLTDLSPHLRDFADTAAVVDRLDLVITVDTAVAHLAGAMGKPVWVLLPFVPDWRWMLKREDSPWYPTMRLFRQSVRDEWDPVLARVKKELQACAKGGKSKLGRPSKKSSTARR